VEKRVWSRHNTRGEANASGLVDTVTLQPCSLAAIFCWFIRLRSLNVRNTFHHLKVVAFGMQEINASVSLFAEYRL
jgi:hypothetical protein